MATPPTPYASLLVRVADDPSRPIVTDMDLATGDRVELSVTSVANGAAKAAHLVGGLAAELGRPPRIAVHLPLHWQVVTFALGAWAAGAALVVGADDGRQPADAALLGPAQAWDPPVDVPDVTWGTRLHPLGLPLSPPPAFPVEDLTLALRGQPDDPPPDRGGPAAVALVLSGVSVTTADLLGRAEELAALGAQGRLLTRLPWSSIDGWVLAAVLPTVAPGSVVLVHGREDDEDLGPALARVCVTEQVVATAGVSVAGIPRLC